MQSLKQFLSHSFQILHRNTSQQEKEAYIVWDHIIMTVSLYVNNSYFVLVLGSAGEGGGGGGGDYA